MKRQPQLLDGTLRLPCSEIEVDCKEDLVPVPEPAERTAD